MEVRIIAPGIDCKVTDYGIATNVVCYLIDCIYYNEEYRKNVITLHFDNEERCVEIYVKEGTAIVINGRECCLPDAASVVTELLCEKFLGNRS